MSKSYRAVILTEGQMYGTSYLLAGAVRLPEKPLIIRRDGLQIGEARNFQKDPETGDISAEIEIFDERYKDFEPKPVMKIEEAWHSRNRTTIIDAEPTIFEIYKKRKKS